MDMELRFNNAEFTSNDDGTLTVSGYVNETETYSGVLGNTKKFIEKIARGAFSKAIDNRKQDIDFLAEHDKYKILASTRNNTLNLVEDERGLFMSAIIVPTTFGKDYYELIRSGILQNMSFGFRVVKDNWKNRKPGLYERTIKELELIEVSVVRNPAYSSSTISARGIDVVEDVKIPEAIEEENKRMEKLYEALTSLENRMGEFIDVMKESRNKEEIPAEVQKVEEKPEEVETLVEEEVVEEVQKEETLVEETEEKLEEQPKEDEKPTEETETEVKTEEVNTEKVEDKPAEKEEEEEVKPELNEDRSAELVESVSELRSILSELREKGDISIES